MWPDLSNRSVQAYRGSASATRCSARPMLASPVDTPSTLWHLRPSSRESRSDSDSSKLLRYRLSRAPHGRWCSSMETVDQTKRVLVHGAAGNVGAYAVQLARRVAHEVIATAFSSDVAYVQTLGAHHVIDVQASRFEEVLADVDVVLDTVGGETQERSFSVLKRGGVLVSAVSEPDQQKAVHHGVRAFFILVDVSSERLEHLANLIEAGELTTSVGDVLPLAEARTAHEMLAGKPHKRGKIVLRVEGAV